MVVPAEKKTIDLKQQKPTDLRQQKVTEKKESAHNEYSTVNIASQEIKPKITLKQDINRNMRVNQSEQKVNQNKKSIRIHDTFKMPRGVSKNLREFINQGHEIKIRTRTFGKSSPKQQQMTNLKQNKAVF